MGITTFTSYANNDRSFAVAPTTFAGGGHFVYLAWADNELGSGYTSTFSADKRFFAIRTSTDELSPSASTFTGLWQPVGYPNKTTLGEYNFVRKFDTNFTGHQQLPQNFQTLGCQAWYHEGTHRRVYFTYHSKADWTGPTYSDNYVSYYDIDTGEFAEPVAVGIGYNLTDPHVMAFPMVTAGGYILLFHEKSKTGTLWDPNTQHNSEIVLKRSNNPEDISAFSTVGDITSTGRSYPHLWKLANGNIHCAWRAGSYDSVFTSYSTDDGATFKSMSGVSNQDTEVCRLDLAANGYAYHTQILGSASDGLNLVVQDYDYGASPAHSVDNLYFLHSDDGITWGNVNWMTSSGSGEFSKNIVTGGYITQTELDANCKIVATTGNPFKWNPRVGSITPNGIPVIQYVKEDFVSDNRIDNAYISYWNGSSWTQVDITSDIWKHENLCRNEGSLGKGQSLIPYDDTTWDLIVCYCEDGTGTEIDDYHVKSSGKLLGRTEPTRNKVYHMTRYCIVETDGTSIPSSATNTPGYITNCTSDISLNASNRAKNVRLGLKVMRTTDAGVNWHEVKKISSEGIWGMGRAGTCVGNFMDTGKFFQFMGDMTSANKDYPDSTDLIMIYEDFYTRDKDF